MSTVPMRLSDELAARARAQAQERGFGSPADAAPLDPELEELLIERIEDTRPSIEATPEFWQALEAKVRAQAASRAGSKP